MAKYRSKIGRLKKVPLREVWENEANDFSTWLGENLDLLEEVLDIHLSFVKNNASAGTFLIDILAEDLSGNPVVIENQLEKTDHDHLGKIITYISSHDAKTGIWISKEPKEEHEKAIQWLNEVSPADIRFYLLKVEAMKIGDSKPAPLFSIIAGPEPAAKKRGEEKKKLAKSHLQRKKFWEELLAKAKEKTSLHANISPQIWSWVGAGAGKAGMVYSYVIFKKGALVELYIDKGKGSEKINKKRFDSLYKHKKEIERLFGGNLEWERLDNKRASRIAKRHKGVGLYDEAKWPVLQDKLIDSMVHLEMALKEYIRRLE